MEFVAYWVRGDQKCLSLQIPASLKRQISREWAVIALFCNMRITCRWKPPVIHTQLKYNSSFSAPPDRGRECQSLNRRSWFDSWQLLPVRVSLGKRLKPSVFVWMANHKNIVWGVCWGIDIFIIMLKKQYKYQWNLLTHPADRRLTWKT